MKSRTSLLPLILVAILLSSLITKAELPPLGPPLPPIVTLPYTFSNSHNIGYIDVDGNSTPDFYVYFQSSGSGSSGYCIIEDYAASYAGNQVLTEFFNPSPPPSPGVPSLEKIPLSTPGEPFTALLKQDDIIGPLLISPGLGGLNGFSADERMWYYAPYIFETPINPPTGPLASNYTSGVYSGYIGVHYLGNDGWYYGWLNVEIDPNKQWVTINSAGHASASSTPVPAGLNDPFAVPIPIIASILGFGLIGGGVWLKRRKKKLA